MVYEISASSLRCWTKEECERLLKKFPCLTDFGFGIAEKSKPTRSYIRDENGKHIWQEGPPEIQYLPYIELNTLDDLERLTKTVGESLVYSSGSIEIYDTYRE